MRYSLITADCRAMLSDSGIGWARELLAECIILHMLNIIVNYCYSTENTLRDKKMGKGIRIGIKILVDCTLGNTPPLQKFHHNLLRYLAHRHFAQFSNGKESWKMIQDPRKKLDPLQKPLHWSLGCNQAIHKISSKSVPKYLRYSAHIQTDTDHYENTIVIIIIITVQCHVLYSFTLWLLNY